MKWNRVRRGRPCELCGHDSWCTYIDDAIYCMRPEEVTNVPEGWGERKRTSDGGVIYGLGEKRERRTVHDIPVRRKKAEPKEKINWGRINGGLYDECNIDMQTKLAKNLGVCPLALAAMGLGWCGPKSAYSFPMYSPAWEVTGIRLRTMEGAKFAVKGSKEGVFGIPVPLSLHDDRPVIVVEGPTDTAAMIGIGYRTIGRPSCSGCKEQIVKMLHAHDVVIIADSDGPGRRGATDLADALYRFAKRVRVIEPVEANDPREWIANGATEDTIDFTIQNAVDWRTNGKQVQHQSS